MHASGHRRTAPRHPGQPSKLAGRPARSGEPAPARRRARRPTFDDQLAAMAAPRDEGLIAGVGLSNASLEQPGPEASASGRTQARRGENRAMPFIAVGAESPSMRKRRPPRHPDQEDPQIVGREVIHATELLSHCVIIAGCGYRARSAVMRAGWRHPQQRCVGPRSGQSARYPRSGIPSRATILDCRPAWRR
jgi:hypothetical protein